MVQHAIKIAFNLEDNVGKNQKEDRPPPLTDIEEDLFNHIFYFIFL